MKLLILIFVFCSCGYPIIPEKDRAHIYNYGGVQIGYFGDSLVLQRCSIETGRCDTLIIKTNH